MNLQEGDQVLQNYANIFELLFLLFKYHLPSDRHRVPHKASWKWCSKDGYLKRNEIVKIARVHNRRESCSFQYYNGTF